MLRTMDTQKENGISPKEKGSQRGPPSYSVETPYGFHLDLDFLKYVDDIEKGNTIRRVPMQRRQRGRNNGILSRNLSLPGYGCRATEWNSVSTLWPKTKLGDSQQHFEFRSSDSVSAGYARRREPIYKSFTSAEMEAFDEQPLGRYVRPNLLRASSLPLTVLLRKHSESTEDPTSPSSPNEYLMQENGSSEDVFHASNSRIGRANGTLQRLTAALERVAELQEEIRVVPELKAQICILQEERERLLLQLHFQNKTTGPLDVPTAPLYIKNWDTPSSTRKNQDKASDDWMNREYDRLEENVKASSEQVEAVAMTSTTEIILPEIERCKTVSRERDLLENGDKTLTETLQRKCVLLEQTLHVLEVELDRTRALLKQQVKESLLKDEKIKQLTIQLEMGHTLAKGISSESSLVSTQSLEPVVELQETLISGKEMPTEEATAPQVLDQPPVSHADMEHHVKRLQELLQEQWECLCEYDSSGKMSSDHLSPRVCTIQEQLTTLVTLLTLYVFPTGDASQPDYKIMEILLEVGENPKTEHLKTISIRDSGSVETAGISTAIKLQEHAEVDVGLKKNTTKEEGKLWTTWTKDSRIQTCKSKNAEFNPKEDAIDVETTKQENLHKQTSQARALEDQIEEEAKDLISLSVDLDQKSLAMKENREAVDKDFIEACYFLRDHMDKVSEPDNELSQALTVVFQQWFHISAEKGACADIVALYLNEVNSQTPTVLQFLVNMADDNGNTALHYSVSHCNFSIVKLLLDTGVCEVDLRNKSGYTTIMLASLTAVESPGDMKVVQQLMALGDVNACVGQVGQTALHLAVRHGCVPMVRLLLEQGADPNAQDRAGTTPLISACDRGHINIVQILLQEMNCDVNLKDKGGRSALSLATQASHTEIADLLKARTETKSSDKCKKTNNNRKVNVL
ncbi:KN motif and ankyrin repeat domain-containing protein 4-like [Sinocyclocheilus grahami]|uniref:KN motif and ankyrin repeat domain-containing protein 4-like n=1 Tax=Sinocyclocheilus grahami TaxID=75366 RepID=UPI0007ACEF4A|nr:PREDICTED: KN motif and ankyrin repeat domain-containing protein 4-like [Sinocyclocheilus grahami]